MSVEDEKVQAAKGRLVYKKAKLRKKVRKAYSGYINMESASAVERYRKLAKIYKRLCKKDRKNAWNKFKESVQSEKEMADLAKLVQRRESNELNTLDKEDGTTTTPGKETLDLLMKTHFKLSLIHI